MLAEPASVCARAIRHARAVGERQPWRTERALVVGTGAIGMLSTYFLRLDGFEVWTAGRSPAPTPRRELVEACGARYLSTGGARLAELAGESGGFDVVIEAAGDAQVMLDTLTLLRRNGVACLLGVDGRAREVTLDGRVLGVDAILAEPRAVRQRQRARARLGGGRRRSSTGRASAGAEALEAFVGLRVPVDRFAEAFEFRGVKATLRFD